MPFAPFNNNSPSCVILILSSAVTDLPNKTLIFHDIQGPIIKFHDFPGLENEILKFHDFPGFPWPVQTRLYTIIDSTYTTRKYCYCCKMLHCSFNLNSNRDSQIQHFFTFGLVQGIFLSQNESFITYQVWSLRKKKMAAMALDNPSSDSFQSTLILLQCSCLPCYSKTKRFLGPTGRNAILTKSELSFSLEVVSAVSGSVVMVLQITSLTFSWTSAPSTSLSWDTNHRQQYSELTTLKIEVHDCVQFCSVLWWIYHHPHILLHSLNNHDVYLPTLTP